MIVPLDLSDPNAIEEYERAFYAGFAALGGNPLLRRLWHWDEKAERLRACVPYEEQTIFLRRYESGAIEMAVAFGIHLKTVQSNFYGFDFPRRAEHCESLVFFNIGKRRLRDTMTFWRDCSQTLRERGFKKIYATTAPRVMPLYLWVGGEILATRDFDGQTRYFFEIDLEKPVPRRIQRA